MPVVVQVSTPLTFIWLYHKNAKVLPDQFQLCCMFGAAKISMQMKIILLTAPPSRGAKYMKWVLD